MTTDSRHKVIPLSVYLFGTAFLILAPLAANAQPASLTIPAGTPFPVRIDNHLPMRVGQPITAQLMYPVYADNALVLPGKTTLTGTVTALHPNHARRIAARLRGDFTPFYIPVVRFTDIHLEDGTTVPITAGTATDGAPIYRLVAPPPHKGGFIRQHFDEGVQMAKDRIAIVTAPGRGDRALQFLYSQIPYHPQRIEKGTAWTVETSAPIKLPEPATAASTPSASPEPAPSVADTPSETAPWIIQAYLSDSLSSASSKTGDVIHATVAEPIYNPDHTIAVPQGTTIVGAVTQCKPARRFGRAGTLRFDFRQIVLPSGTTQNVSTTLTGLDSASNQQLALDSEGNAKPKPQDKLLVPFILLSLAARPLDRDHGDHELGKDGSGSNSIGVVGFIIGTAARMPNIAAGIGYYGAAISLYNRWIKRGTEVAFAHDTRLVLQTTPRNSAVLKPERSTPRHR